VASVYEAAGGAVPPNESQERILPAFAETKALAKLFESRHGGRDVDRSCHRFPILFDAVDRDPDDRPQNLVEMTETGKARFERLKAGLTEAEDRALAPLAPADRRELLRLLRILHDYHAVPPPSAESRG
jgi:hypothetical protein